MCDEDKTVDAVGCRDDTVKYFVSSRSKRKREIPNMCGVKAREQGGCWEEL
jgi:hypothetical protein